MVKYKRLFKKGPVLGGIIVGITVLVLDFIAHNTIGNVETVGYFLAKPIISGYIAFLMFNYLGNVFSLPRHKPMYYIYYATLFAVIHGVYYRVYEIFYKASLFSRVGDVNLGFIILAAPFVATLGWYVIHGGSFLIGTLIAKMVVK